MARPSAPKPIPGDEDDLLRDALKDVAPLPDPGKAALRKAPPPPVPRQRLLEEEQVLAESLSDPAPLEIGLETGEELVFLRPGLPRLLLRKLKRGEWAVQDELDLHGQRSEEARTMLSAFLATALKGGLRCIRVIHGKGLRSENGEPVLKRKVGNWLAQRDDVLAFIQARPEDGGGGAVMVLLKSRGRTARTGNGGSEDFPED